MLIFEVPRAYSRSASCLSPKCPVLIFEAPRAYSRSALCLFRKRPVLIFEVPRAYSRSARLLFRRPMPNLGFRRPSVGSFQPLVSFLRLCLSFASFSSQLSASSSVCLLPFCMVRLYRTPAVTPAIPSTPAVTPPPPPSPSFLHPLFQSLLPFVSISPFPLSFSRARIYYIMCNHSALPVSAKKVCTFFVSLWKSRTFASAIEGSRLARRWPSYDALLRERVL